VSANFVDQTPFLRTSRSFGEDPAQIAVELTRTYTDIASKVNNRIIAVFPTNQPAVTGESWFLTNQRQQTIREVYSFGAINAGAELDIPTNITNFTQFTRIYGTVVTAVPDYRPLPYVDSVTLTNGIALLVGTVAGIQQIRIIVGTTSPNITNGLVVLEWLSSV
jgi:hypothetical protein